MILLMGMKNYYLNCDSYDSIDGHEKQAIHFVPIMKFIKITYITVQDYFSEL